MSILTNSYPQIELAWELGEIPTQEKCFDLWDKYEMFPNIREHCTLVADFARALASKIHEKVQEKTEVQGEHNLNVFEKLATKKEFIEAAHRAGLLHDIAKTWTIQNGGSHQQVGASIVRLETNNPLLASCVLHHVVWPWQEGILGIEKSVFHLPFLIAYADKRVRHTTFVSLEERFSDLFDRYGKTEDIRKNILLNLEQAKYIENTFIKKLEFNLNACTLTSGVLVA